MMKSIFNSTKKENDNILVQSNLFETFFRCLLALVLLSGGVGIFSVQALSENMVPVLVFFYSNPGPEEGQLITSVGGYVNNIYHIVPAVSALIPADKKSLLMSNPSIKSVEDDIMVQIASQQLLWGVDRIDAQLVNPTNKGTGVKVAILDTGIDLDHPDLNVVGSVSLLPAYPSPDDDNGHGTLVAGIVAALDNDIGAVGIAPEASLYAVKVLNKYGSGAMSVILRGIEWAIDNNMQVINMSFGSSMGWPTTVIDALYKAYCAGIVIVAGAGNGGNPEGTGDNIWAPARYYPVIAVGATDNQDNRYSSSSTGSTLDLMAPGVNVYSTAMGGGYGSISYTSASSPHAAGVAALLIAGGMSGSIEVRLRLRNTVEDLGDAGWDSKFGWGLVDAYQAINYGGSSDQTAPVTTISLNGTAGSKGWYSSDVQAILTAIDNQGGSGVAETRYSMDGGTTWHVYSSPFTISTNDMTRVKILAKSWDNAGNVESPPASGLVKIDKAMPTTSFSLSGTQGDLGWYRSNIVVTLTASDNQSGSGVSSIAYSLNNGQTWNTYTAPFTVSTEGINRVLAKATDVAGNIETPPTSSEVKIDTTPPVLTETAIPQQIPRQGKTKMVNVNYSGTANDALSGIYLPTNTVLLDEYGKVNRDLGSSLSGTVALEAWCDGNDKNGRVYTLRLTARDYAGNQSSTETYVTILHPERISTADTILDRDKGAEHSK